MHQHMQWALSDVLARWDTLVTVFHVATWMNALSASTTATHLQCVQTQPVHTFADATRATLAMDYFATISTSAPLEPTTVP